MCYGLRSILRAAFGKYKLPKIYVKCQIHGLNTIEQAMLDTGSTYTVIDRQVVQPIENQLIDCGEGGIETWQGPLSGRLVKLSMTLIAEGGENMIIKEGVA